MCNSVPEYADLIGAEYSSINCWELVVEIFSRAGVGLKDYDVSVDATRSVARTMKEESSAYPWNMVEFPSPMCVVMLRVVGSFVSHCGVYLGNGKFIHSVKDVGVIVSKTSDPLWSAKLAGYCEYVGK